MVDIEAWMALAVEKLKTAFGPRLALVGLQGSYRRGEATEESDIDILLVLDTLSAEDIIAYRALLDTLPEGDRAGGFTGGRQELLHWPAYEIFPFERDTKVYYGSLEGLLPAYTQADIREGVRIQAANLYHAAVHLFASGEGDAVRGLEGLLKSLFFLMKGVHYLRTGVYPDTRAELEAALLPADEGALLRLGRDRAALKAHIEQGSAPLLDEILILCGGILTEM